jgi:hypothetical protein
MKFPLERLKEEILSWPHISVHPHRFGGREFRFGKAEVGHVHLGGIVDIPFPRSIRDALLDEGLAESINGFRIQGGLLSAFALRKTSSTQSGSCACPTSDMC